MKPTLSQGANRALALLLLFAVATAAYFGIAAPIVAEFDESANTIIDLEFRIARYAQVLKEKPVLEKRLSKIVGGSSLKKHLLPGASAQLAAANLQNRLKKLITRSGGTFVSAQTLDAASAGKLEEVVVGLKLDAEIDTLKTILYAIESDIIHLVLDNVSIRAKDDRSSGKLGSIRAVKMKVALQVKGYRRNE